ncbi:protein UNIFOLIATA-like [Gastrolobium bilobum]|uniref:protein UNIFOLIATA-like n=1 Tax=Gastrolobium bilobum TaxID=150636 RepID=UPI002AB27E6D|nr:protein UNIFOLIATA-like [Gastrolobium bilobum]
MDPDAFTSTLFKWDPRTVLSTAPGTRTPLMEYTMAPPVPTVAHPVRAPSDQLLGGLEELFHAYGVRYYTAAKVAELGFTVSTLVDMKDDELDDMMNSLSQIFRWDLPVGERYGIKAAVRAERRRIEGHDMKRRNLLSADTTTANTLDALSQEGWILVHGNGPNEYQSTQSLKARSTF